MTVMVLDVLIRAARHSANPETLVSPTRQVLLRFHGHNVKHTLLHDLLSRLGL